VEFRHSVVKNSRSRTTGDQSQNHSVSKFFRKSFNHPVTAAHTCV
jgi:hypothetical protein